MDTLRSKKIQQYIQNHPKQKVQNQTLAIAYGGKMHRHELYNIPIEDFLIHNIRNGRFRSELLEKEEQLKRKLDPTKKKDDEIIRKLLLEQNENETTALTTDIQKNGQLEPGDQACVMLALAGARNVRPALLMLGAAGALMRVGKKLSCSIFIV